MSAAGNIPGSGLDLEWNGGHSCPAGDKWGCAGQDPAALFIAEFTCVALERGFQSAVSEGLVCFHHGPRRSKLEAQLWGSLFILLSAEHFRSGNSSRMCG